MSVGFQSCTMKVLSVTKPETGRVHEPVQLTPAPYPSLGSTGSSFAAIVSFQNRRGT